MNEHPKRAAEAIAQREERWRIFLEEELSSRFDLVGWFLKLSDGPLTLRAAFVRERREWSTPWWFVGAIGQISVAGVPPFRTQSHQRTPAISGSLDLLNRFPVQPAARALLELQARAAQLTATATAGK